VFSVAVVLVHRVLEKKLDPLFFHHIFALYYELDEHFQKYSGWPWPQRTKRTTKVNNKNTLFLYKKKQINVI